MRADALVRRRRPVLAVLAVAAVAALGLAGCGRSIDQTNVVDSSSPDQVNPLTTEPLTTQPLTTEVVAPVASPGGDSQLVVGALPDGWTYSREAHPNRAAGDRTVIKFYDGLLLNFRGPGGSQARQSLAVTPAWQPGQQQSGQWANPRTLVPPQVSQVAGSTDATDVQVGARPGVLLTLKVVPDAMRKSLPADVQANVSEGDHTVIFVVQRRPRSADKVRYRAWRRSGSSARGN